MHKCKKLDDLPVVSEWQNAVYCPNCAHYSKGQCSNPARISAESACPFDNKELPVKLIGSEDFKFNIGQTVLAEFQPKMFCNAKIIDRKTSDFGNLYQLDWSQYLKEAHATPWMMERFLCAQ